MWRVLFLSILCYANSVNCLAQTVQFRAETVNMSGEPTGSVALGDEFALRVWVEDVRASPLGVFSAFLDVGYSESHLESVSQVLIHGPQFGEVPSGGWDVLGLIDEAGSFANGTSQNEVPNPPGAGESLLFSVPLRAIATGVATLTANPADVLPRHATTVFGENNAVDAADMIFVDATIAVSPRSCDFNADEICTISDIDLLVSDSATGTNTPQFDLNIDGLVNEHDIVQWLATAGAKNGFVGTYLRSDVNLDGGVDSKDLNSLGINWQAQVGAWSKGDFNGDGIVDSEDLNLIGINWQMEVEQVPGQAPVPEPSLISVLVGAAIFSFGIFRRKRGAGSQLGAFSR